MGAILLSNLKEDLQKKLKIRFNIQPSNIVLGSYDRFFENAHGQYDASLILQKMKVNFPKSPKGKVKLYIGITSEDIYEKTSNFLFGLALTNLYPSDDMSAADYGVISYRRFTGSFNHEDQKRSRLVSRTFNTSNSKVLKSTLCASLPTFPSRT